MSTFTAADLKAEILKDDEGWYVIEEGKYVPNPNYNPAHDAESKRLYELWRSMSSRDHSGLQMQASYEAYAAFRRTHQLTVNEHMRAPFVFTWEGVDYSVKIVEDNGGREGGGEAVHMVYEADGRLFRLDGSYYSYDGTTWDDESFREVKPVVKSVTFYE